MRARVLKEFSTANDVYHVGQVIEVDPRKRGNWLRSGKVAQDTNQPGTSEAKTSATPTKRKGFRARR